MDMQIWDGGRVFCPGHQMQDRARGTQSRDCLKPQVPVQSQAQFGSPQPQAGPSPSSQSPFSSDEGVTSSTWHLSKPAHFTPMQWKLSPAPPPRGSAGRDQPNSESSGGLVPAAKLSIHHSHGRPRGLLLSYSSDSLTAARSLSLCYRWKRYEARSWFSVRNPLRCQTGRFPSTRRRPNAPRAIITCPNSSQAAEGGFWGHHQLCWVPISPGTGSGARRGRQSGLGGAGTPPGARCRRRSLLPGQSHRICGARSSRGRARGEKAFKGDA